MERSEKSKTREFKEAGQAVEEHGALLKKELGLRDLVLTQILFMVGLGWVGVAAQVGTAHVVFWVLAIILFYIPLAAVVIYLNRLMPLEGGLYQWAKLGFNSFVAFMVAWNLWLYAMTNTSILGLLTSTNLAYALGARASWMASNNWLIIFSNVVCIGFLVVLSILGLSIGKWVNNAGGVVLLIVFASLLALPFISLWRGYIPAYHPFATSVPPVSLFSLNILGKMGFGALGGFELVAIMAGESKDPGRNIGRSVMIAAPLIALMLILGTSSVLAFVKPGNVDLISPIAQVLSLGFRPLGFMSTFVSATILVTHALLIAQASFIFTTTTRLPMVTGWDNLLPEWFSRIHEKFRTPVNAILFVGALSLIISIGGMVGVRNQEAFQLFINTSGILYAASYLVMFAIPIIGLKGAPSRPRVWLKVAACSGFLMTVLYVVLSIFPIIDVKSWFGFTSKVIVIILVHNLIGVTIYVNSKRRQQKAVLS
ncbi:MAG TPA: APC family permease [Candidatus Dormibacteraeota bacterium]|nr:APC family permease [Candidatus Dormibacteraeota bacterium]